MNAVAIFVGGGLGSLLRYSVQLLMGSHGIWATFLVNVVGCFLIGGFGAASARFSWNETTRLLLTTGLCGGFTTFSTFGKETLSLLQSGNYAQAILYVTGSVVLGVAAAFCGFLALR
ncbi:MAG: fluoride efflux transporter CrcB [Victivallales bacterium]|nr:fluoride efflux transporter CrcB [Victivallales bacterium]